MCVPFGQSPPVDGSPVCASLTFPRAEARGLGGKLNGLMGDRGTGKDSKLPALLCERDFFACSASVVGFVWCAGVQCWQLTVCVCKLF